MTFTSRVLVIALALSGTTVLAAKKAKGPPPAIAHLLPCGGKAGTSFPCSIGGTLAKAENKVWTDHPGLVFKPTAKADTFDVSIAADVPLGPHLIRFYNEDGAAPPHVFMVGSYEEVAETEPNDDSRKAQLLAKIPVTVNGTLQKSGDADTFAFKAEAGSWIVLALDGYALGSQMDPSLRLLDEHGVELAMSHDTHNLDPLIAYEVKKAGIYKAQVMAFAHPPAADVTLKGSADHVYRLTITDQAYAKAANPSAIQQNTEQEVKLVGWNLGPKMKEATPRKVPAAASENGLRLLPTFNGESVLTAVVTTPVVAETEPNNESAKAPLLTLPCTVSAAIAASKDEDKYRFTAKKGDAIVFRVHAFRLHSPLDAVLKIEDAQGKVLKEADDEKEGEFDPSISFKAPADGEFIAAVTDRFSRCGWSFIYALECGPAQPRLTATLDANGYKLEAGKTVDAKVTVKAVGDFKGKISVKAEGLPAGVTAKDVEVPAKGGEAKLTLTASADAITASQPFTVIVASSAPDAPVSTHATFDLRGVEPRGDRLINEDTRAWLTLAGKAAEPAPASAPTPASTEEKK